MQSIASGNALRVGENEVLVVGDGVLTLPTAMLREPSQFGREYRRRFGAPSRQDIAQLAATRSHSD